MANKVLLINMPFAPIRYTVLGIHLLKAILEKEHIECDVYHANIDYAKMIGSEKYQEITFGVDTGDLVFSKFFYGKSLPYHKFDQTFSANIQTVIDCESNSSEFINNLFENIDWHQYRIIGFSSCYSQNLSSFTLAREIKKHFPEKTLILGGTNCNGPAANIILKHFPFFDYIFQGESDITFPLFVKRILNNKDTEEIPRIIKNIETFDRQISATIPSVNLNDLPYPNFDDWFQQLKKIDNLITDVTKTISIETSRGCWWHECSFCGDKSLLPATEKYKSKTTTRALSEIKYLAEKYKPSVILLTDSVVNTRFFDTLFPKLALEENLPSMVCEVKCNLSKQMCRQLKEARFDVVLGGVESFSSEILNRINKGCSALDNIYFLKSCTEMGITVRYNLLYDFPGDNIEEYVKMCDTLKLIYHLPPPTFVLRVIAKRFSNLYETYKNSDTNPVFINDFYRFVYPTFEESDLMDFVGNFHFNYTKKSETIRNILRSELKPWRTNHKKCNGHGLIMKDSGSFLMILDRRPLAVKQMWILKRLERHVYVLCDSKTTIEEVHNKLEKKGYKLELSQIKKVLDTLSNKKLIIEMNGEYLSLAISIKKFNHELFRLVISECFMNIKTHFLKKAVNTNC